MKNGKIESLINPEREWSFVKEVPKIQVLLSEKLARTALFMKGTIPPAEFYFQGIRENGVEFLCPPDIQTNGTITLYRTVRRQLEIDFELVEVIEPGHILLQPVLAKVGNRERMFPRYVNQNTDLYASNFMISKNEPGADMTRAQVTNQVVFSEFEKSLSKEFPDFQVHLYSVTDQKRPRELTFLNNNEHLYIPDIKIIENFSQEIEGSINFEKVMHPPETVVKLQRELLGRRITAVCAVPIVYEGRDKQTTIGHIHVTSMGHAEIPPDMIGMLMDKNPAIIERILDANTITVKERQRVLNVSETGLALQIKNLELKKYVPQRDWITFDLIYKLQAPMKVKGKICHVEQVDESMIVGIDIEGTGHSHYKKGTEERFKQLVSEVASRAGK